MDGKTYIHLRTLAELYLTELKGWSINNSDKEYLKVEEIINNTLSFSLGFRRLVIKYEIHRTKYFCILKNYEIVSDELALGKKTLKYLEGQDIQLEYDDETPPKYKYGQYFTAIENCFDTI